MYLDNIMSSERNNQPIININKITVAEIIEHIKFDECYRKYRINFFKFNDLANNGFS